MEEKMINDINNLLKQQIIRPFNEEMSCAATPQKLSNICELIIHGKIYCKVGKLSYFLLSGICH